MKKIAFTAVAFAAIFAGIVSCSKKDGGSAASDAASASADVKTEENAAAPASNKDALIARQIEGIYINANDLEQGVIADTLVDSESGFTFNATAEKTFEVKKCDQRQIGDDLFVQAISTKGSGKYKNGEKNERTISFHANAGDSIIVYATTSSKTDSRPLHVVNMATDEEIGTIEMMADNGKDVTVEEVVVKDAGDYCVYSTSGAGYIYQIKVGK